MGEGDDFHLAQTLHVVLVALVGSLNYEQVKALVLGAETSGLSGDEKRARVAEEARNVGIAIGYALLNLAIETAVVSLRGGK